MKSFYTDELSKKESQRPFSVGGKIRVGTKALSGKYANNPAVQAIMKRVNNGTLSFKEAEKELYQKHKIENPFYPRNTREFHAHPWDMGFGGAATSQKLLELYGEMREGDQEPKLYRFPVVFPEVEKGNIDAILGGGLSVQSGGTQQIRYYSKYGEDGVRYCNFLPPVVKTETSQRKIKQYTRRTPMVRGQCIPGECNEYAFGLCRFSGTLRFYIPGISGAGIFEMNTGSTDAASEIYLRLSQAAKIMNGSLINYRPGTDEPVFWLTKHKVSKPYYEDGEKKVSEQWVPMIDINYDMSKVIWISQQRQEKALLSHGSPAPHGVGAAPLATPSSWMTPDSDAQAAVVDISHAKEVTQPQKAQVIEVGPGTTQPPSASTKPDQAPSGDELAERISQHADANGYEEVFVTWAENNFGGDNWINSIQDVYQKWTLYVERFGSRTGLYLQLLNDCGKHQIDPMTTIRFLKLRHGELGTGANLEKFIAELKAFMDEAGGAATAMAVMESALPKNPPAAA